jgi:hypothetical protein
VKTMIPLSVALRAFATLARSVKPNKIHLLKLLRSRPRLLTYEARDFDEYQVVAAAVAEHNSSWLRTTWFRAFLECRSSNGDQWVSVARTNT